ncbi:MAG: NADP-dependent phosphogluconate dehydrogenase [Saprospiraceae bacterium]|nr:NADP-dependent phosphogluconate dehydrogenase [Saprospiraceae bacterium]
MSVQEYDFGMVGLGTMGRNLVLNMLDHGFSVAGYDQDPGKVAALVQEAGEKPVSGHTDLASFTAALRRPRTILLLVPAGPIVDAVLDELRPWLQPDDLLVDCGNSHYTDTDRRSARLEQEERHFMGVGVSGGESGARFGPSIMPGGAREPYARIAPMLEAVSAKINGESCVAWLGPRSAGNYVKMVHNGIEYALMQLLAETYHLLKEVGGLNNDDLHELFARWNRGPLQSFLVEITADIFAQPDELSPNRLIDVIRGSAKQKGTGMWTSQDALSLHAPIPAIDTAVAQRDLSALAAERAAAQHLYGVPVKAAPPKHHTLVLLVEQALQAATLLTYAQGMALLSQASRVYQYGLQLSEVARIWRGGCIIRAAMLEDIRAVFSAQPELPNFLLDPGIANRLLGLETGLRQTVQLAAGQGIPVPVLMASLAYFDSYRRSWLPANLIQAQRDFFGAHTYERTDREGVFHTQWGKKKNA